MSIALIKEVDIPISLIYYVYVKTQRLGLFGMIKIK